VRGGITMGEFKHKKFIIIFAITVVLVTIFILLVILPFLKSSTNNSSEIDSLQNVGDSCENPYQYITEYMPIEVQSIEMQDVSIDFKQMSNINKDTDKIIDNLYPAYSANQAEGIKDCYCEFDEAGNVFFSRVSEDDYDRYENYKEYAGETGTKIVYNLENIPEHRYVGTGCVTFQKDTGIEVALLTTSLYSNVAVNVLMSKDFSQIDSVSENNEYKELKSIYDSGNVSSMSDTDMAAIYHYQQRVYRPEEDNIVEEQFVYYTYFILDDMEYIVQFISNYTVMEGQKEYMVVSDLHSQEECQTTLLSVLRTMIE